MKAKHDPGTGRRGESSSPQESTSSENDHVSGSKSKAELKTLFNTESEQKKEIEHRLTQLTVWSAIDIHTSKVQDSIFDYVYRISTFI